MRLGFDESTVEEADAMKRVTTALMLGCLAAIGCEAQPAAPVKSNSAAVDPALVNANKAKEHAEAKKTEDPKAAAPTQPEEPAATTDEKKAEGTTRPEKS